jgi:hypothetical protein
MIAIVLPWFVALASASDFILAPARLGPPNQRPVNVTIAFQPLKLLDVDSAHGFVRIQGYFDQFWRDGRLGLNSSDPSDNGRYDKFDAESKRRYYLASGLPWVPDLAFPSASLRSNVAPYGDSDPHFAATFSRVYENGDVHFSLLVDLTVPVNFSIEFFPYEVVRVPIVIESYGNTELDINLKKRGSDNDTLVDVEGAKAIPGYEIVPELATVQEQQSQLLEGNYTRIEIVLVLKGSASDVLINGITTTTVLIMIGGVPLWYDTDFNNKMAVVATALLTSFALAFSFELPSSRQSLLIELFFLSHQLFLGAVAGLVFLNYMLKSIRKSLLPTGINFMRQDEAMKLVVNQLRKQSAEEDAAADDPALEHASRASKRKARKQTVQGDDAPTLKRVQSASNQELSSHAVALSETQKQVALLSLIELGLRDEKASEHSPIRPWQLFSVVCYTLLWCVNIIAFTMAGQYLQAEALKVERANVEDGVLQREAGVRFLIVYAVAGTVAIVVSLIFSYVWRHKHDQIIFCCARIMVKRFTFDDDEEDHQAELRTLASIENSNASAATKSPPAVGAADDDDDDDNAPPPAYGGTEMKSARTSAKMATE